MPSSTTVTASVREFRSSDPAEIERILEAELGIALRLTGSPDGYLWSLSHTDAGPVSVDTAASSGFTAEVEPGDGLVVVTGDRGVVTTESQCGRDVIGPGETALVALPGLGYRVTWSGDAPRARSVRLDPGLVRDVAVGAGAVDGTEVRFTGCRPLSPAAQRQWQDAVEHVARSLTGAPGRPASPLVVGESCRYLAALALATFPNITTAGPGRGPEDRPSDETLRLALEFIEQHAGADIGLADIARAASVTGRAVQLAFRRHLDTTPLAYLRSVRLARAHRELVSAEPDSGLTVTEVAARSGFGAASRFARYYRETFGVRPSETLAG